MFFFCDTVQCSSTLFLTRRFILKSLDAKPFDHSQPIEVKSKEEAENVAHEMASEIKSGAKQFEHDLMVMDEGRLAKTDISGLGREADEAVLSIANRPLVSADVGTEVLAPYKEIIANAYDEAHKSIQAVSERFEDKKKLIFSVFKKLDSVTDKSEMVNKNVNDNIELLDTILKSKKPNFLLIRDAVTILKKVNRNIRLNFQDIDMMREEANFLRGSEYQSLSIAASCSEKIEATAQQCEEKMNNLSGKINEVGAISEEFQNAVNETGKAGYTLPSDEKYDFMRRHEKDNLMKGNPLLSIDQDDVDKVMALDPGAGTVIKIGNQELPILKAENGDYVLPNGRRIFDMYFALYELRKSIQKENKAQKEGDKEEEKVEEKSDEREKVKDAEEVEVKNEDRLMAAKKHKEKIKS